MTDYISLKYPRPYRIWEYEIAQSVHKRAQDILGAIVVCPGPSTVYRSSIFQKIKYSQETMAEDMDLTYLIHRKKLGKIIYQNDIMVETQDPATLKDYIKQIERWYTGFWQCVEKYQIPWGNQSLDFEVALIAGEGLFSALVLVFLLSVLFFLPGQSRLLFFLFCFDFFLLMFPTVLYTSFKNRKWYFLKWMPVFYFLRLVSGFVFLNCFFAVVLGTDVRIGWQKARRYKNMKKGEIWLSLSRL